MIIKKTTIFKHFFNDASLFHSFSIFPVTLIISGLLVQVFAALNLGRVIHLFRQKQRLFKDKEKFKIDAQNHLKSIREIVRITSLIMVTSTICTFLLFLIPIPFLSDLKFQDSYYQTSISLGVYWGIIFSLTLLFLGLWSFYSWSQIVNSVLRDKKFQADQDISKWLIEKSDLFSLVSNAHFSLSIAFPLIMSILSAIASKMF